MDEDEEKSVLASLVEAENAFEKFIDVASVSGASIDAIASAREKFTGGNLTRREIYAWLAVQQDFNLSVAEALIAIRRQDADEIATSYRSMLGDAKKLNVILREFRENNLSEQKVAVQYIQESIASALARANEGGGN